MTSFEELIPSDTLRRLASYRRIYVGFSGGLDSTVLLHYLQAQSHLRDKLVAVHVHHGLQPAADSWLAHCKTTCQDWGVACQTFQLALTATTNIESSARQARYQTFASLIQPHECFVTAHHQDDQAETLLLHLMRGTGIKGLSGIAACSPFHAGFMVRPLLESSRAQLQAYATQFALVWVEDASNRNLQFSRNFMRHDIMPRLQQRWPAVCKTLARTADISRSVQANLDDLAVIDCPMFADDQALFNILPLHSLYSLSVDRVHNVVRYWLQRQAILPPSYALMQIIVEELIHAKQDAKPCVWVDTQHCIRRYQDTLYVDQMKQKASRLVVAWENFPESCCLPNHGMLHAEPAAQGLRVESGDSLHIRFRQGGENFVWHQQTKSLKKLFQEWQIPPWLRNTIPLLFINNQLAMVVGYAISDSFFATAGNCFQVYDDFKKSTALF